MFSTSTSHAIFETYFKKPTKFVVYLKVKVNWAPWSLPGKPTTVPTQCLNIKYYLFIYLFSNGHPPSPMACGSSQARDLTRAAAVTTLKP